MRTGSWIGVDLDGTLATHYWSKPDGRPYDETVIGDPVPAMVERVKRWVASGVEVRIFTARVGRIGSAPGLGYYAGPIIDAIHAWTLEHIGTKLEPTCEKDYFMVELWDDRAVRVEVDTGQRCCGDDIVAARPEERTAMASAFALIAKERARQEALRAAGKFAASCATTGEHQMSDAECLAVLGEEAGEVFEAFDLARALGRVSRAVCEQIPGNRENTAHLVDELVQTAAVAVAWLERLGAW